MKNAFGTTVNDVLLAVCAGALRRWLSAHDALPDEPLVAAVPVSTRTPEELDQPGNLVSGWFATLATNVEDPAERLRAVRDGAAGAKAVYNSGIEDVLIEWGDLQAPLVMTFGVRMLGALHLTDRVPPIFNLIVSNVRLTGASLFMGGAPVEAVFPLGPVLDSVGLNITASSQHDAVHFGLLSCPELAPDLEALADALWDALGELVAAADRVPAPS